jgi:hypothetical protein
MRLETKYDEYGWKIIVSRSKDGITHIYLRSRTNAHQSHKPFYLRLDSENLLKLLSLLKRIEEKSSKEESK